MGTNSIKSNLSKETAISQIKLSLGADIKKENMIIVVEGQDDIKFLRKFCKPNTKIFESYSGKQGVEEIICSKIINDFRVIGIRDKDYCNTPIYNRIFFYDKCCLEMMILSFDEIFESLYSEFYNGKINSYELKELIFKELYKISITRKYNEENGLSIKFSGLNFNNLITNDKLELPTFINELKKINSGKYIPNFERLLNSKVEEEVDYFNITNGHDFLYFFKTICDKSKNNTTGISKDAIPSAIRTSFSKIHFKLTKLYQTTKEYCKNNTLYLWDC